MTWNLHVLGTATLVSAKKTLTLERKIMAVLGYLALEGPTPRSKIAGLLWPDSEESTARNNLAQALRRLRKATDQDLILGTDLLSLKGLESDATKLKVLSFEGNYNQLLSLGGELLAPYDYDDCPDFADWLFAERERILTLCKDALSGEMARLEKEGNHREALMVAEALLGQDTLSEDAHRWVMRLHYVLGDRAAALKAFENCKMVLDKELGVEPTHETEQLAKQIEAGKVILAVSLSKPSIPLTVLRPPLVGRENELAILAQLWEAKKIVFIRGEPGVGKSRLSSDFLEDKASLRLEGRPGDSLPFSSYTRAVRQWFRHNPIELPAWVKRELSRLDPSLSNEAPSNDTLRLSEAITEFLRLLTVSKINALVLDDLQFMDTASFELSRYLFSTFVTSGLRIIASYRSGEVSDETSLMQFVDTGQATIVDLQPLDSTMTSQLLEQIHIPELKHLGHAMQTSTGGNPTFIIETVKHLLENKRLDITPDKLPSISKVSSLIQKRLEQLSPKALRLAQVAAVAGTEFDLDLASTVLETHLLDLAEPFAELENKQVMRSQAFVHDLLFETALSSMPVPIKTLLHLRIARTLYSNNQLAKAAQHYLNSQTSWQEKDAAVAVMAFIEIAKSISLTGDLQDGAKWFEKAFECAADKPTRARILTEQAKLLERHLQYPQAIELLDLAEHLAVSADAVTRATIWNTRSTLLYEAFANFEGSKQAAQKAFDVLEGLETTEAKVETANALKFLGVIAWQKQDFQHAEGYYRKTLEILRLLGNQEKTAEVLNNLGIVMLERVDSSAQAIFEEALEIWEKLGYHANLARVLGNLGHLHWKLRNLEQAETYLEKAISLGNGLELSHIYNNLGMVRFSQGNYQAARESYQQALDCQEIKDNQDSQALFLWNLAEVDLRLGHLKHVSEILQTLLTQNLQDTSLKTDIYWLEGDLYALENQFEKAKESYRNCLAAAQESGNKERQADALARLARLEQNPEFAQKALEYADTPIFQAALQVAQGNFELAQKTIKVTKDPFEEARLLLDIAHLTKSAKAKNTAQKLLSLLQSTKRGS